MLPAGDQGSIVRIVSEKERIMNRIKQSVLAGILAVLLFLTGCAFFTPQEDPPVPEEYQQTAVVVFED